VAPSTTQPAAHQGNPLQQQHQQQLLLVEEEVLLVAVEGGVMWRSSDDLTCFAWAALQRVTPDTGESWWSAAGHSMGVLLVSLLLAARGAAVAAVQHLTACRVLPVFLPLGCNTSIPIVGHLSFL